MSDLIRNQLQSDLKCPHSLIELTSNELRIYAESCITLKGLTRSFDHESSTFLTSYNEIEYGKKLAKCNTSPVNTNMI